MTIFALWLPILVSAAFVFVVSAIIWMAMPWHKSDFNKSNNEEGVRLASRLMDRYEARRDSCSNSG